MSVPDALALPPDGATTSASASETAGTTFGGGGGIAREAEMLKGVCPIRLSLEDVLPKDLLQNKERHSSQIKAPV